MLDLTTSEMVELILACDHAIKKERELMYKYEDTMPWKAQRYAKSLQDLQSAREKIKKGV